VELVDTILVVVLVMVKMVVVVEAVLVKHPEEKMLAVPGRVLLTMEMMAVLEAIVPVLMLVAEAVLTLLDIQQLILL
jgi:hypothetical protein